MKKTVQTNYTDQEFRQLIKDEVKNALSEMGITKLKQPDDEYITMSEAIELTKLSKSTIYKLVHYDKIPYTKQGAKKLLFNRGQLAEWIRNYRSLD